MHPKLVYIAAVVVPVGGASKRVKPSQPFADAVQLVRFRVTSSYLLMKASNMPFATRPLRTRFRWDVFSLLRS